MNTTFQKARKFIYRNAKQLDLARWQYHFENDLCSISRKQKQPILLILAALKTMLSEMVHCCITQETAEWETSYICKPSKFLDCPSSMFYADNQNIADFECDFIVKTQLDDGSWNITWDWSNYPVNKCLNVM